MNRPIPKLPLPSLLTPPLVLALVLLAALLTAPAVLAQDGGPQAVPVEPIKDFDIVPKGDVVSHDFEIRNAGDEVLLIEDVRPACGCTVARYDSEIAPGAIGTVHAEVDTTDFIGPISKSIAVFTNDDENPKLQLVVKAKVRAFVAAYPGYARFLYVQQEPVRPLTQVLFSEDDHPLDIVKVETRSEKITAEARPAREDEKHPEGNDPQWAIDVHLNPDAEVGNIREFIYVTTDHPKQASLKIPVSGFVRPRQHVTPHEADFGKLQGDSLPLRRTFYFTNFITAGIEVEKIETGYQGLAATVEKSERQPGHRFTLTLEIGPEMPKGEFDTVIQIHTTDEIDPVVELPVKGVVL